MKTDISLVIEDTVKLPAVHVRAGLYANCRTSNLIINCEDGRWMTLGGEWVHPPTEVYTVTITVHPGTTLKALARRRHADAARQK